MVDFPAGLYIHLDDGLFYDILNDVRKFGKRIFLQTILYDLRVKKGTHFSVHKTLRRYFFSDKEQIFKFVFSFLPHYTVKIHKNQLEFSCISKSFYEFSVLK